MTGPGQDPAPQTIGLVQPDVGQLQTMNQSANQNASPVQDGLPPCPKKSWFAIRVIDDKDAVIEGLTLKLRIPGLGDIERITSKVTDPVKVDQLDSGGKGDVTSVESAELVWEAIGDVT